MLASRALVVVVKMAVYLASLCEPHLQHYRCHTGLKNVKRSTVLVNVCGAVQRSWFARVNALCNLSCKKSREVAASLLGRFLSRRCFTLCTTMEVEPRIAKQYKCHHCCSCKNYVGKGIEGGKKCLCVDFWLTRRSIASSLKKCI